MANSRLVVPKASNSVSRKGVAQETISALRIVREGLYLADPTTTYENARAVGLSVTAGTAGQVIEVLEFGEVEDAFFSFPAGVPLFLGPAGIVTATPPTSGFSFKIGYSLTSTKIQIDLMFPIQL
jgi:hypothetical protein